MKKSRWIKSERSDHKHAWKIAGSTKLGNVLVFTCRFCDRYFGMKKDPYYAALTSRNKKQRRVKSFMAVHYGITTPKRIE